MPKALMTASKDVDEETVSQMYIESVIEEMKNQ